MNTPSGIVDHLVLGGGPAGAMAALRLAQAGRQVTLLEKERAPHDKVCGEFLSEEAVDYLGQAGISARALGAAPIRFLRLCVDRRSAESSLPFGALSLSRGVLDAALLDRAADEGCAVVRGASVDRLTRDGNEWCAQLAGGAIIRARTVFLATGKHDLRGWKRGPGTHADLIGFKMHWRLAPAQQLELREWMELFLFPGGYGGLSLIEKTIANFCFVIRRSVWRKWGDWGEFLGSLLETSPRLRRRLEGAQPSWTRPLTISPIPYGYVHSGASPLWRVGDQAAVIPSFTGDGISIALHSASLAAQIYLSGGTVEAYQSLLRMQLRRSVALSTWISRAMVTAPGRQLALVGTSILPRTMQWVAASTRVPARALLSTGQAWLLPK
jgi:flavin-dependent dehydrogenase